MKRIVLGLLLIFYITSLCAFEVTLEKAEIIAENWSAYFNNKSEIRNVITRQFDNSNKIYIFNFESGWIMISSDDSRRPVLGFSFDSNYNVEQEPLALEEMMNRYFKETSESSQSGDCFSNDWENCIAGNFDDLRNDREVEPLIQVFWSQGWPYNAYCPLDDDPDLPESFNGHHNTSCGPTAMAQVLSYWCYPVHGYGYHSYWYDEFNFLAEADFENTYYNWSNMPVSLDFNDTEPVYTDVANLMLHSAVMADGAWESGAGVCDYSASTVKYMGYSPTNEVLYRDDFSSEEWHNIYWNDLDNGRPIMMSGCAEGSVEPWENGIHYGHYFICDGYYGDDFFHINWGWGGYANAYFPLFSLGDYILHNYSLIGLEPNYGNKKLILNDPFAVDDNTVALLHFDGDLINESSLTEDPESHGVNSFLDNSDLGLGQCLYLDNSSQSNHSYLDIVDDDDLDLSGDWTIEMWFKPVTLTQITTLLNKPVNNNESNFQMELKPSYNWDERSLLCYYTPQVDVYRNPASIFTEKNFLEEGNWYHVSFIRNTQLKNLKLVIHDAERQLIYYKVSPYCNEVAEDPKLSNNPLYIGSKNLTYNFFNGYIDELRISNIVRDFEISNSEITLINPNGGELWLSGSTQQIQWNCCGLEEIKLEYSADNGLTWECIIDAVDATSGQYDWLVPELNSGECRLKISDLDNENTFRISNSVFMIYQGESLELISPDGGECLVSGSTSYIQWSSFAVSLIDIQYSLNNGYSWNTIVNAIDADEHNYCWIVPPAASDNCLIRIVDASNPDVFDISYNLFSLVLPDCAAGPYACDENTILLFHYENDLNNQSELADDGYVQGDGFGYNDESHSGLGKCLDIDESTYLSVLHNENLSLQDDWTIEMWFKLNSYDATLINKMSTGWQSNYNIHTEAPDGHMEARFFDQDGNRYQIATPSEIIMLNQWYHVAFIKNSADNSLTLIIRDEDLNTEFNYSISYPAGTVVAVSSNDLCIGESLDGFIDEVRISNTVCSFANEVEADFGADVYSGESPLEVCFVDFSSGDPTLWQWDCNNDGVIDSQDQNPSFLYEQPGLYSVQLIISNGVDSDVEIKTDYIEVIATDADDNDIFMQTELLGNYPNPFNATTSIWYNLSERGDVKIEIFNIKGQHVITLFKEEETAGSKTILWKGLDKSSCKTGSGVYLFKMISNGKEYPAKKCILLE